MNFFEKVFMLDRLDDLIHRKGTGSPCALAKRLKVSERTVYNLLDILKAFGAEIDYCRERESYCYSNNFRFSPWDGMNTQAVQGGNNFTDFLWTAWMVQWRGYICINSY